jgi:hypothetical protein
MVRHYQLALGSLAVASRQVRAADMTSEAIYIAAEAEFRATDTAGLYTKLSQLSR